MFVIKVICDLFGVILIPGLFVELFTDESPWYMITFRLFYMVGTVFCLFHSGLLFTHLKKRVVACLLKKDSN